MPDLSDTDRTILAIERRWWRYVGMKEQHVRAELGMSIVAYYQRLNVLLDDPAAEAADPLVVHRLRRLREARVRRSARRVGFVVRA